MNVFIHCTQEANKSNLLFQHGCTATQRVKSLRVDTIIIVVIHTMNNF